MFFGFGTLNIYTQIGLVTLVGLIAKHGILIVEFANAQQRSTGAARGDAVRAAARTRIRPILMTTAAMVGGLLPDVCQWRGSRQPAGNRHRAGDGVADRDDVHALRASRHLCAIWSPTCVAVCEERSPLQRHGGDVVNMRAMNIALPDLARQKAPLNVKDSAMTGRMYRQIATLSAICGMAFLSACSVAPEYAVPQMTLPAQYKYALSEREIVGAWQDAQPADASVRGEWWSLFDDHALNLLQDAARQANPSLQSALARLNKARAAAGSEKRAFSPDRNRIRAFTRAAISRGRRYGA